MEPTGGSPGKKHAHHDGFEAHAGAHPHSKFVGPTLAETVHASEKFDKAGLLAAHLAALHDAHMLERGLLPGTSLPDSEAPPIPPVYAESPWKAFKPLTLADMKVGKTHRRHFLEGRLCAKSLKVTSVVNVLEEASGLATKIILTNALPARASMVQAQNCYPEGARVTVRDPYLTRFPDGVVGVLVERPNDIAFLSRPESTGENSTRIYGAVEGHDNDRVAQSTSREHEDFSRKIHMFEEQMKQETFHSPSHSHSLKPLRDETRFSPAKEKSSPAKEVDSAAPQDNGASPDNVVSEEASSTTTVEVQDQPIPEAVEEKLPEERPSPLPNDDEVVRLEVSARESEPSPEGALHVEGKSNVEEDTQPQEPSIEIADRSGEEEQTNSTATAEALTSGKEDDAIPTQVTESTSAKHEEPAHEEPQSEPAHEEPQSEPAHEEPQSEPAHEEPPSEPAHEEPPSEPAHEEPPSEPAHEEPPSEPAHEEPPSEPAHEEPPSEPAHEDPPSEPAHEEPPSEPAHEEPPSEPAHEEPPSEPPSEPAHEEPPSERAHEEPPSERAHEEPPSERAHEEPPSERAHEEPRSEPAHEEPQSEPAHEEQSGATEGAKMPLIRKRFQRSDSLLAVHENEHDAKPSSCEWAGEPAIAEKPSTPSEREENQGSVPETKPAVESEQVEETHSANDLRVLGNLCFGEENYQGAADLYTRSLRLAEEEETRQGKLVCSREVILGYSNRAEAYIRLQEYGKALADAKKALSRDPSHLKSLFRKGRALLGLSQYEQALTTLQAAAPRAPSDRDLQAALHESTTAVQQSCHGHYDLSHYYLKGKQTGESPHCADYIGPVAVTDVGRGRGRGLVLTKDVEAGELLLVSNPIVFLPLQGVDQTISQAFVNGKVQEGFRKIIEASHAQNKGLEKVGTLYDGEKALPAPSVHQTHFESASHLDAAHIRRVIQLNAINGDATMGWKNLPGSGEQDQKVEHWGLWWLPSFINHSCLPSSSPILVGNALFVFASRDLRAGDEVTRPYFDIFQPLEQRKELSAKGWGFLCHCPRCKLEDALHTSLSKVTEDYVHLMELASQSKAEFGTDEKLSAMQTSAALKFFHKLETKLKDFKLNASENNWVRSSFLHYIDMINGDHELHTHLESVVEALGTVCPGSETTLHMAVVAKDSCRRTFGKKSNQFKHSNQRALNICRYTYGKQRLSVLQSIVDKNDYQS